MSRFYRILGATIVTTGVVWTASGLGQPIPGVPAPPAHVAPGAPVLPTPPISAGRWSPPPVSMAHADVSVPPFPPPPMPGQFGIERFSVAEGCFDVVARRAALRAYLKARLNLNSEQLAAWQDYENAASESEADERQACSNLTAKPGNQTVDQRMDTMEEMLARRLAQARKVGAPLRKVVATLSPDQLQFLVWSMPLMAF